MWLGVDHKQPAWVALEGEVACSMRANSFLARMACMHAVLTLYLCSAPTPAAEAGDCAGQGGVGHCVWRALARPEGRGQDGGCGLAWRVVWPGHRG